MPRALAPLLTAFLLAGCELLAVQPASDAARPPRAAIAGFSLDGRIAAHQAETRTHASIAWQHSDAADAIVLSTPLGQGVAELTRDGHGARLVTADRQSVEAADWTALAERIFGFALPLDPLPRWALGDVAASTHDAQGRPLAARVDGWDIRYLDYESAAPDALPVLMEFRRDDIELRLKVDAWRLD